MDGYFLHSTIKIAAQFMSCTPIKPNNIINMKCTLGFCNEFTEYNIPDEEIQYGPKATLFPLSFYPDQERCAKYGIILNGPTS